MGIEPTFSAWEADVLPLNYTRSTAAYYNPVCKNSVNSRFFFCDIGKGRPPPSFRTLCCSFGQKPPVAPGEIDERFPVERV